MDIKAKLLLTIVDNRLIHGQVGITWTTTLGANLVIVVDEMAANDFLQQKLMQAIVKNSSATFRVFTVAQFLEKIEMATAYQKVFIVVKEPQTIVQLIKGGLDIDKVNLGNMHYSKGKIPISRKIYVNDDDLDAIKYLLKNNVKVSIQDVPDSMIEYIDNVDKYYSTN